MNKKIFLTVLFAVSSSYSFSFEKVSFLQKAKSAALFCMLNKQEMISGYCLAPLSCYAALKAKKHYIEFQNDQKKIKSLQKMLGWAVAGGLCNYTVYQNIEGLFQKIPLQKKKILKISGIHTIILLLDILLTRPKEPVLEFVYAFAIFRAIIMGIAYTAELRILREIMKKVLPVNKIAQSISSISQEKPILLSDVLELPISRWLLVNTLDCAGLLKYPKREAKKLTTSVD